MSNPTTATPSVLTSPLTIAVVIAGALVGALIGSFGGPIVAVIVALLGALVALGVRIVSAGSGTAATTAIDPFTVQEPWRRLTQDALRARTTFSTAVERTPEGPMRDRLATIAERVDAAIDEVWHNARAGHELAGALRQVPPGSPSATRLSEQIATTEQRLQNANRELSDTLSMAIELSVSGSAPDEFNSVESRMSAVADELDAIHAALNETSTLTRRPTEGGSASGGATA